MNDEENQNSQTPQEPASGQVRLKEKPENSGNMKELLAKGEELFNFPKIGEVIDGKVLEKGRNRIFFDMGSLRLGVVYKSEIDISLYDVNSINPGDVLPVKVLALENEDGLVELSLREAGLDKVWQELLAIKNKGEVFPVTITDANRGGLIGDLRGVTGFLPVSQLSPENYPHVEGGDKEEIFRRLKEFVGKSIEVKILDMDRKASKLIFSERAKVSREIQEKLLKYSIGQAIEGEVSGIVDFGAFVTFDGIEGLVHISELGWQLVENPEDVVSQGEKVQAKIIAIEDDKVSLSLKALKPNPWKVAGEKYKIDDTVKGEPTKFNPFGAFIKVEPEIQGLTHISEFESYEQMVSVLKIGETYDFRVVMIDPTEYKMALQPIGIAGVGDQKERPSSSGVEASDSEDETTQEEPKNEDGQN